MKEYTALVRRSEKWWAILVPEVPGVFTQCRKINQIEPMAKDAVALMLEIPENEIKINIKYNPDLETERYITWLNNCG